MKGTWQTSGPDLSFLVPLAAAAGVVAVAFVVAKAVAGALAQGIVIAVIVAAGLAGGAAGWGAHMLAARRRNRNAPADPALEWAPARRIGHFAAVLERPAPPPAIAAPQPVQPQVVNNFFGADPAVMAAALLRCQQPAPAVIPPADAEEAGHA